MGAIVNKSKMLLVDSTRALSMLHSLPHFTTTANVLQHATGSAITIALGRSSRLTTHCCESFPKTLLSSIGHCWMRCGPGIHCKWTAHSTCCAEWRKRASYPKPTHTRLSCACLVERRLPFSNAGEWRFGCVDLHLPTRMRFGPYRKGPLRRPLRCCRGWAALRLPRTSCPAMLCAQPLSPVPRARKRRWNDS